ncbi:efflux RND transporter periplasmic adaptor subunit [Roseateles sp. LKC17W]|uniref:Efflux RND transporter periplasmic adaptor subunit n=1 Tax=Pelomonas margarita TaxID=3299031 RepID=A0ABW7FI69_9BURK
MKTSNTLTLLSAAVAVAGALLSITLASAAPTADTPGERAALSVAVTRLTAGTLPQRIAANGNIAAWQEASIGAEANGLRLVDVRANVGDTVRRGQMLASFAPETVQADLALRRAAVAEARVALAEAAANARRAQTLQDTGALSAQQIEQQLAAEAAAQARLDAAQAAEALERLRLAQTRVVAPDDGVISARSAAVGAVVPAGQELFRLVRGQRLEWRAEVPAGELARLKDAHAVRVTLPDGRVVQGRLRQLAPLVDVQTRNGLAYVDLPQAGTARAGMFAQGEFELGSSRSMTLPRSAVQVREGFHVVFRVGSDSRALQTKVDVGRQAGDRIEIVRGLQGDERVVASGVAFLSDNDLVRVVGQP